MYCCDARVSWTSCISDNHTCGYYVFPNTSFTPVILISLLILLLVSAPVIFFWLSLIVCSSFVPGLTSDQPIDYSTTWGLMQWTESNNMLSNNPFDGSTQNLKIIVERLASRVITAVWKAITKVDRKDLMPLNLWLQGCSSERHNSTKTENLSSTHNRRCLLKCLRVSEHLFQTIAPWKWLQVDRPRNWSQERRSKGDSAR